ncbi:MAG: zinc-binding dehydrogenase [Verrucomicrobiota bacterium]|nr:zinc-binding dehydrogenase [Limisphaera sp.]MDW8381163.1 zinc-binding dehydrogenase [Verrucomicrobiota bacterium]
MKAWQLLHHGTPGTWRWTELPDPIPGPEETLIRVKFCGLNHLDLWIEQGALPVPIALPRIPGAEVVGEILQTGPACEGWKPGQRVAVQSNLFCGACEFCRRGEESTCLESRLIGVDRDGGLAEHICVPTRALVTLPDRLSYADAAAVTLAASTAMHMLTHRGTVGPGQWVLVIAAGSGVGSAAIQIARHLGARVITTGSTPAKRELGYQLGAELAVDTSDPDWPRAVRRHTGGRGVDWVIDHVGGSVLEKVFQCLARNGTVVTCGATAGREPTLALWPFFVKQHRLIGSSGRNRASLIRTLEWVAAGYLRPVIDSVHPLPEALIGLSRLRERRALGKVLVQVDGT